MVDKLENGAGCAKVKSSVNGGVGKPKSNGMSNTPVDDPDFVWRFRLDEKAYEPLLHHPLDELLRVQWEELLKLCIPMYQGNPVKIDGFATMQNSERVLPIYSDDIEQQKEFDAVDKE